MNFTTILQIRQKPDSYSIGQHTLSEWDDPHIPNNQIEWYTKRRGVHFIVGILIKFESNYQKSLKK